MLDNLKIAIVCDWLTTYAGAERVIFELHKLFPKAPIYTTLYNKKNCAVFKMADVRESLLKYLPFARKYHQVYFPFMPKVFERIDLDAYDIVISSSHSAAKGVITRPETLHVSYCHSPMRYVWDNSHSYVKNYSSFSVFSIFYKPILHRVRIWDRIAAERVDKYIANSDYVKRRISKYYDRDSEIIYPPVDLSLFNPLGGKEDYYLAVGRLIPYKRFDLVVKVCEKLGRNLHVVGDGHELSKLKRIGKKNVKFFGKISDEELKKQYQGAKALIFPQVEDFGIVPLEAMACGTPVIAFADGGALETVKDGVSGIFFKEQTEDSLLNAIKSFEEKKWDLKKVADSVNDFAAARFKSDFLYYLENAWKEHREMIG